MKHHIEYALNVFVVSSINKANTFYLFRGEKEIEILIKDNCIITDQLITPVETFLIKKEYWANKKIGVATTPLPTINHT